ncbi:hypothetical protein AB0I89_32170 [Micromonospora sp. NPDC049801]|uniref:hypothetical protein n=1 Tax=unclassified Micromonospora TaxID=2617518 RepID=UPI0033DF4028
MARPDCPVWCLPTAHNPDPKVHMSVPVVVVTPAARFVMHLESAGGRTPYLTVAQYSEKVDETDEPTFEPDNLLVLKLAEAAAVAGGLAELIGRALGGDR